MALTLRASHEAYRFRNFAATVAAKIIDSRTGCFVRRERPTVYLIEFPDGEATVRTELVVLCSVEPIAYRSGRDYYLWVQYDRDNPRRVQVYGDDRARDGARRSLGMLVGWMSFVVIAIGLSLRRERRPSAHRAEGYRS